MKGTLFLKPLEWQLMIEGEAWSQGQLLKGTLTVKNHGTTEVKLKDLGLSLIFADLKKVRQNSGEKFKAEQNVLFDKSQKVAPKATAELAWTIQLDKNCPITDKKSSYYLQYGHDDKQTGAYLQLIVNPQNIFLKLSELLDVFFRFKVKEKKCSKTGVEFKLVPPDAKDFLGMDDCSIIMNLDDKNNLNLEYFFTLKKLDYTSNAGVGLKSMGLTKSNMEFKQSFTPKEYLLLKDALNQDFLLKKIPEVLNQVKTKSFVN
ncbi:MAG: hypothetical protein JNM93_05395 [Bacteriovoracaceae bacterium]|nr:hypothetical protein [Bacteriovoracaceae bacterium]